MKDQTRSVRSGFGLIEVVISTLLVSLMMIGSLTALASFTKSQEQDTLTAQAMMLANAVMTSITSDTYENISLTADDGNSVLDDVLETNSVLVELVDRIDSLNSIFNGSEGTNDWTVQHEVSYLSEDLSGVVDSDLGIKHIEVIVFYQGSQYQSMESIVTKNLD